VIDRSLILLLLRFFSKSKNI